MRHLLLAVFAFGLGAAAADTPSQGGLQVLGPIEVVQQSLTHSGDVVIVDAELVNTSDWWIGDLSATCRARQYYRRDNREIDAHVLQVGADKIGPGERVPVHCEVELIVWEDAWNISIVAYGSPIEGPEPTATAVPWPTIRPGPWPTFEPVVP